MHNLVKQRLGGELVATGPDEVAGAEPGPCGDHVRQQGVGGDVERQAGKQVRAALAFGSLSPVSTVSRPAWSQRTACCTELSAFVEVPAITPSGPMDDAKLVVSSGKVPRSAICHRDPVERRGRLHRTDRPNRRRRRRR